MNSLIQFITDSSSDESSGDEWADYDIVPDVNAPIPDILAPSVSSGLSSYAAGSTFDYSRLVTNDPNLPAEDATLIILPNERNVVVHRNGRLSETLSLADFRFFEHEQRAIQRSAELGEEVFILHRHTNQNSIMQNHLEISSSSFDVDDLINRIQAQFFDTPLSIFASVQVHSSYNSLNQGGLFNYNNLQSNSVHCTSASMSLRSALRKIHNNLMKKSVHDTERSGQRGSEVVSFMLQVLSDRPIACNDLKQQLDASCASYLYDPSWDSKNEKNSCFKSCIEMFCHENNVKVGKIPEGPVFLDDVNEFANKNFLFIEIYTVDGTREKGNYSLTPIQTAPAECRQTIIPLYLCTKRKTNHFMLIRKLILFASKIFDKKIAFWCKYCLNTFAKKPEKHFCQNRRIVPCKNDHPVFKKKTTAYIYIAADIEAYLKPFYHFPFLKFICFRNKQQCLLVGAENKTGPWVNLQTLTPEQCFGHPRLKFNSNNFDKKLF